MIIIPTFENLINEFNQKTENLSEQMNISKSYLLEIFTLGEKLFLNRKHFSNTHQLNQEYPQFSINKFLKLILKIYEQTKEHEKLDYLFRAFNLLSAKQFFENFNIFENIKIPIQYVDNLTIIFKLMLEQHPSDLSSKLILESFSILIRLRNYSTSIIIDIAKNIIHLLSKKLKLNILNPFQFIDLLQQDSHYFDPIVVDPAYLKIPTRDDVTIDEKRVTDSFDTKSYQNIQNQILSKFVEIQYLTFPVKRFLPKDQINKDFYKNLISDDDESVLSEDVEADSLLDKDTVFDIPDQNFTHLIPETNATDKRKDFIFDLLPINDEKEEKLSEMIQNSNKPVLDFSILGMMNQENVEPPIKKNAKNHKKNVSKHKKRYYDE